jgi:chromosome segregation ATPase
MGDRDRLVRDVRNKANEVAELESEYETLKSELSTVQTELKDIDVQMEAELESTKGDGNHAFRTRLHELEGELTSLNEAYAENEGKESALNKEAIDLAAKADRAEEMVRGAEDELATLLKHFDSVKEAASDHLKDFGPRIPNVLDELRINARQFHHRPIGPLGLHVKVRQPKWTKVLAAIVGSHLPGFICHDNHDRQLLQQLLTKHGCNNPIYVVSREPLDTSSGEPASKHDTALRVLDIDNEMVRKVLIIFTGIEQTVLSEDRGRGQQILDEPNVQTVYSLTHKITKSQRSVAFMAIYASHFNPFESGAERLKALSKQLDEKQNAVRILRRDLERLNADSARNNSQQQSIRSLRPSIRAQIGELKNEIRGLEETLAEAGDSAISVYENEKRKLLEKQESLTQQFAVVLTHRTEASQELAALENERVRTTQQLEVIEEAVAQNLTLISGLSQEHKALLLNSQRLTARLQSIERSLDTFQISHDRLSSEIQGLVQGESPKSKWSCINSKSSSQTLLSAV